MKKIETPLYKQAQRDATRFFGTIQVEVFVPDGTNNPLEFAEAALINVEKKIQSGQEEFQSESGRETVIVQTQTSGSSISGTA